MNTWLAWLFACARRFLCKGAQKTATNSSMAGEVKVAAEVPEEVQLLVRCIGTPTKRKKPLTASQLARITARENELREQVKSVESQLDQTTIARAQLLKKQQALIKGHRGRLCKMSGKLCSQCAAFVVESKRHGELVAKLMEERVQFKLQGINESLKRSGLEKNVQVTVGLGMVPSIARTSQFKQKYHSKLQQSVENGRPLRQCAVCANVNDLRRCGKCGFVYYCCADHQRLNWLYHKEMCKSIASKSCVTCSVCSQSVNVWLTHSVWATAASASVVEFICSECRGASADIANKFPRVVYALCSGVLFEETLREKIAEFSRADQLAYVVHY